MFCPNCGNEMNDNTIFCSNCGWRKKAKINLLNIAGIKIRIFIILGVMIILGLLVWLLFFSPKWIDAKNIDPYEVLEIGDETKIRFFEGGRNNSARGACVAIDKFKQSSKKYNILDSKDVTLECDLETNFYGNKMSQRIEIDSPIIDLNTPIMDKIEKGLIGTKASYKNPKLQRQGELNKDFFNETWKALIGIDGFQDINYIDDDNVRVDLSNFAFKSGKFRIR